MQQLYNVKWTGLYGMHGLHVLAWPSSNVVVWMQVKDVNNIIYRKRYQLI